MVNLHKLRSHDCPLAVSHLICSVIVTLISFRNRTPLHKLCEFFFHVFHVLLTNRKNPYIIVSFLVLLSSNFLSSRIFLYPAYLNEQIRTNFQSNIIVRFKSIVFGNRIKSNMELFVSSIIEHNPTKSFNFVRKPK